MTLPFFLSDARAKIFATYLASDIRCSTVVELQTCCVGARLRNEVKSNECADGQFRFEGGL